MSETDATQVITVPAAARVLGVSEDVVWRELNAGHIPGFRVGRRWRIPADVVARMAAAKEPTHEHGGII